MKILLQTLTPLHIGNGEDLFALDYVKYNSCYFRINQKQFIGFIQNDTILVKKFNEWIINQSTKIDQLREKKRYEFNKSQKDDYSQQLTTLEKSFNLLTFIEQNSNRKEEFIKFLYDSANINKIPYQVEPKNNIRGFIKTPLNVAYVPGTSIKGAIRTAILYKFLLTYNKPDEIEDLIQKKILHFKSEKIKAIESNQKIKYEEFKKRFGDTLNHLAFFCEMIDESGIRKSNEVKFDIMKLLSVSDGKIQNNTLTLANIDIYLVAKIKDRQTGGFRIIADRQRQAPCLEAVPVNAMISVDIDFDISFLLNMKKLIRDGVIKQNREVLWIGIREKIKNVFNLDIETLTKDNQEIKKQEVIEYILSSLKEFSSDQLAFERNWIKEYSEMDSSRRYKEKIVSGYKPLFENQSTLLHLGLGSGFFGITEFLYIIQSPKLKSVFKEAMDIFNIGDKPGSEKKRKPGESFHSNPDKFPKARRLTERNDVLEPIGWLAIHTNADKVEQLERSLKKEIKVEIVIPKKNNPDMPEHREVKISSKGTVLDAVVLDNGNCEVYLPDKTKKIVKLVSGRAETGKVIEVTIYPDGKGNFDKASFKSIKR